MSRCNRDKWRTRTKREVHTQRTKEKYPTLKTQTKAIKLFYFLKWKGGTKRNGWIEIFMWKKNRAELLYQYRFFYSIFLRFGSFPRFRLSSCLISIYGDGSGYVCVHVHSSNLNIRFDQIIIPISILFPLHLWWTFYVLKEKIEKKTRDTEIETERDWKAKAS